VVVLIALVLLGIPGMARPLRLDSTSEVARLKTELDELKKDMEELKKLQNKQGKDRSCEVPHAIRQELGVSLSGRLFLFIRGASSVPSQPTW
jgi:hypothetical protein